MSSFLNRVRNRPIPVDLFQSTRPSPGFVALQNRLKPLVVAEESSTEVLSVETLTEIRFGVIVGALIVTVFSLFVWILLLEIDVCPNWVQPPRAGILFPRVASFIFPFSSSCSSSFE